MDEYQGSLNDKIKSFTDKDILNKEVEVLKVDLAFKIISAVKKLHDQNIYHFDLKDENIMMMNDYTPIIGDLGFTQTQSIATKNKFIGGTPLFLGY